MSRQSRRQDRQAKSRRIVAHARVKREHGHRAKRVAEDRRGGQMERVQCANRLDREQRPLYAVLFPFEETDILHRLPGHWEVVTHIRQATVWRRIGPGNLPTSTQTSSP